MPKLVRTPTGFFRCCWWCGLPMGPEETAELAAQMPGKCDDCWRRSLVGLGPCPVVLLPLVMGGRAVSLRSDPLPLDDGLVRRPAP